jgi:hypothetical protein
VGAQAPDEIAAFDAKEAFYAARLEYIQSPMSGGEARRHMLTIHPAHHALTGGVAVLETDRAVESVLSAKSLLEAGIQIHRLGDSFSHRREDNPMFLYEPGNGHLLDRTSPDAIQRRPDLYLEYSRTLFATLQLLASRMGISSSFAGMDGLAQIARRPVALTTRWYKWEMADDGNLDDIAIEALRTLILTTARARGAEAEVRGLLSYRPERFGAQGVTAADLARQLNNAVGAAQTPAGVSRLEPASGN